MATLNKFQRLFKKKNDKVLKELNKRIKKGGELTEESLKKLSQEYYSKYLGKDMPPKEYKKLKNSINEIIFKNSEKQNMDFDIALNDTFENIYSGYNYSYSKISNSYVSYKELTPDQLKILKEDKIEGKTYVDRLDFHSKNLDKKTGAIIKNGIRNGLSNQQIARNIKKRIDISTSHSLTIAKTETGRIASQAMKLAQDNALSLGLEFNKKWRHYASVEPRNSHIRMDNVVVRAGEYFILPNGERCQYPRLGLSAGETINCLCDVIEEFEGFESDERRDGTEIVNVKDYNHYREGNLKELSKRPKSMQKYKNKDVTETQPLVEKLPIPKMVNNKPVVKKPTKEAETLSQKRQKAIPSYKKWVVLDGNKYNKSFDTKKEAYEYGKNMRKKGKSAFVFSKSNLSVTNFIP